MSPALSVVPAGQLQHSCFERSFRLLIEYERPQSLALNSQRLGFVTSSTSSPSPSFFLQLRPLVQLLHLSGWVSRLRTWEFSAPF